MTTETTGTGDALGINHTHIWRVITTRPGLQSAHDTLRWDVGKSRILSLDECTVCGELQRETAQLCSAVDCHEHRICERPYR